MDQIGIEQWLKEQLPEALPARPGEPADSVGRSVDVDELYLGMEVIIQDRRKMINAKVVRILKEDCRVRYVFFDVGRGSISTKMISGRRIKSEVFRIGG